MTDVSIVAARRTPIGTAGHALAGYSAADLAAAAIGGVLEDLGSRARSVRETVLGNCLGPGGNVARVAALQAGLGTAVPGLTVDRQCGSGLAAIDVGAALLAQYPPGAVVLAGGTESASTAPWRFWPPVADAAPVRFDRAPFAPAGFPDPEMGVAADLVAAEGGISRVRQDAYAAQSHARAYRASTDGVFAAELVGVDDHRRDERPRSGMTPERLARLRAAFGPAGTATAGNACGIADGAAVVALMAEADRVRYGLSGLRILSSATAGVDPGHPGLGLVPAVREALDRAGVQIADVDVIELNEAFAGQLLACTDQLGLDPARVGAHGGAIALGHPWGASGAILMVRLFSQLVRHPGGRLGLAGIAVGGGQGVAMVVQACR